MENKRQVYKLNIKAIEEYIYRADMFNTPDGNIDRKGVFKRQCGLVLLNLHQYIRMFKQEIMESDVFEIPDFVNILVSTDSSLDDLSNKRIVFPSELMLIAYSKDLEHSDIRKLKSSFRKCRIDFSNCILDFSKCYRLNKLSFTGITTKYIESIILHPNIKELYSEKYYDSPDIDLTINNFYAPGVYKICKGAFYNIKISHINLDSLNQISSYSLAFDGVIDNIIINIDGWVGYNAINPDCVNNLYLPYFCDYVSDEDFNRYKNMLEDTSKSNVYVFLRTLNIIRQELLNCVNSYVKNDDTSLSDYYKISYLYLSGSIHYIDKIYNLLILDKTNKKNEKKPMNIYLYNGSSQNNVLNRKYQKVKEIVANYSNIVKAIIWEEV